LNGVTERNSAMVGDEQNGKGIPHPRGGKEMDVLEAIRTRRSIRKYENRPVPETSLHQLLAAAMSAPSARNSQPWHFVVLDERAMLDQIPGFAPNAKMVSSAPMAILVCGDLSLELSPGYWPVDCAAATENLLLAAHGLGLGAVWCGIYPRQPRMDGFRQLLRLPENIVPHSLVVLGCPAEQPSGEERFRQERVHRNGW
jgi:nitroreductase